MSNSEITLWIVVTILVWIAIAQAVVFVCKKVGKFMDQLAGKPWRGRLW